MSVGAVNKQTGDRIPTAGIPAIDDALDLTSVNPVQNAIITAALANKQDKTDNNLETTSKTVVGAVNELKSGLTNLDTEVNGDATVYPYADVITIEDAVPANLAECNVKIEPVQDLHGYDKPWVGGAGKNKWKFGDFTNVHQGVPFSLPAGTYTASKSGPNTGFRFFYNESDSITATLDDTDSATFTLTSDCVSVTYSCMDGIATNVQIEEGSTATSYAPYTNICPISGHTEASVQRMGKNLFDASAITTGKGIIEDSSLADSDISCVSDYIRVMPNTTYYLTTRNDDGNRRVGFYDQYKNNLQASTAAKGSRAFTTPANCAYCRVSVATSYASETRLELGSSATDKTYTIALGDTIYGGTVDFNTGNVRVTDKCIDLGSLSWSVASTDSSGKYRMLATLSTDLAKSVGGEVVNNAISDIYRAVSAGQTYRCNEGISVSGSQIIVYDNRYNTSSSASDFTTAMSGHQLCYELATPTTIQLTPQQIQLLKGTNTITASTGDISVTVNGVSGSIGAVQEQVNATDAALAELAADIAEQLPTAPTTDGAYVLTVTVADGTPTYSWESAT